jgi:hypothetical protein
VKARASSGSSISPELRVAITLRILAGAQYLDMIWYNVSVDNVRDSVVTPVLLAINSTLDNINLPDNTEKLERVSREWGAKQYDKHRTVLTPDLLGAIDGFCVQRDLPSEKEIAGRDRRIYFNRKGYWAWVCCAMTDAYCRFMSFEIRWPGATSDSIAFEQSSVKTWLNNTVLPSMPLGWVAADDAYSSSHKRVLTPFTKPQLNKIKGDNLENYLQMRAFSRVLSAARITVERAFGQLVRRWGCLWSTMEGKEELNLLMVSK